MLTTLRTRGVAMLTLAVCSILGLVALMSIAAVSSRLADSTAGFAVLSVDDLASTAGANPNEQGLSISSNCAGENDDPANNIFGNLLCAVRKQDGSYLWLGYVCIICDASLGAWPNTSTLTPATNPYQDSQTQVKVNCGNKTKGKCDNNGNCANAAQDVTDKLCGNPATPKVMQPTNSSYGT